MKFPALLLCSLFLHPCFSQQAGNWYFGNNAGIRFTATGLQVLTNGALSTSEGNTTLSDPAGNLLFYTDGVTVWNKNHQPMPNGTGLMGDESSSESALAIPFPGRPDKYLIFTADAAENQYYRGYRYHEVDMTLNGGLGDLTLKNILIHTGGTERMALVKHSNGKDYWLVTRERAGNVFRSYLIDCGGVRPNPVISQTGIALTATPYPSPEGVGQLKASPDGSMIGMTVWDGAQKGAYLYHFNAATGQLNDPISLSPGDNLNTAYGLAFSSNNQFVYISYGISNRIRQYALGTWNAAAINASMFSISTEKPYAMQLGPDNRIYVSRNNTTFLAAILQPSSAGAACNYTDSLVNLAPGSCASGLPAFPNSFGPLYDGGASSDTVQLQAGLTYTIDHCRVQLTANTNATGNVHYLWDLGNGNWDTGKTITHLYADTGNFTVNLVVNWMRPCRTDSITLTQNITIRSPLTLQFSTTGHCTSQPVFFANQSVDTGGHVQSWLWDFDDGQSGTGFHTSHLYADSGQYLVQLQAHLANGCRYTASRTLTIHYAKAFAGNDTTVQKNSTLTLSGSGGGTYLWSPANGLDNASVSNPTALISNDIDYVLQITTSDGCRASDTIQIKTFDHPDIYVPNAFTPNGDGRNDVLKPLGLGIASLQYFRIYNRWGQQIFDGITRGWDGTLAGKLLPPGVYVWVLQARDINGNLLNRKGTTLLIR